MVSSAVSGGLPKIDGLGAEAARNGERRSRGLLIMNADDWGRDAKTTRMILECVERGSVSSASGMVFMEDSERAAALARERRVSVGLHLNLTTPFSSPACPGELAKRQERIASYLRSSRLAQIVYHPRLAGDFQYVVNAQLEEFRRLDRKSVV